MEELDDGSGSPWWALYWIPTREKEWLRSGAARSLLLIVYTELLRDVFGNPFRPVTLPRHHQTPDVFGLALGIYDERAFGQMPVLADALEDAGCRDGQVLGHCREAREHALGCWVLDLVLGKK